MAYRFQKGPTVPDNIRRIVSEEVSSAVQLLANHSTARDQAVHEARKCVKKIRGILRLLAPRLGRTFRDENRRFRDVGRQLSQMRDAAALIEVFDEILAARKTALHQSDFSSIRKTLEADKRNTERELKVAEVIARSAAALKSAGRRVNRWPIPDDGFHALAPGLEQTFRAARKAFAKAGKTHHGEDFHALRKRVKAHWYHLRLLESLWTDVLQAHEASLKNLETWLGNHHNTVVLRAKLEANPHRFGEAATLQTFLAVVAQFSEELERDSLALAAKIFAAKPKHLAAEIASLWKAWRKADQTSALAAKKPPSTSAPAKTKKKVA